MPPLATEERPKAESIVIHAGTAFGGIERRQNAGAFGGHRQSAESRDLCRRMTAAWVRVGSRGEGARERAEGVARGTLPTTTAGVGEGLT